MIPLQGHNLKYFITKEDIVRITASVNDYYTRIAVIVPYNNRESVRDCLLKVGASETDGGKPGSHTHFALVEETPRIVDCLTQLRERRLITDSLYNDTVKNFPKPGGGTMNISPDSKPVDAEYLSAHSVVHSSPRV